LDFVFIDHKKIYFYEKKSELMTQAKSFGTFRKVFISNFF